MKSVSCESRHSNIPGTMESISLLATASPSLWSERSGPVRVDVVLTSCHGLIGCKMIDGQAVRSTTTTTCC